MARGLISFQIPSLSQTISVVPSRARQREASRVGLNKLLSPFENDNPKPDPAFAYDYNSKVS